MGKCKGCGKLGRMRPRDGSMSAYEFSLMLSPVVSVWDCIVRKMRYSYRPEWGKSEKYYRKMYTALK
ncbi:hypothetical protein VNO77_33649 [Canavalia gladiata]|uniref:Uncharacterized protein n=1 Tax=Canavalia gladiata TaxID=3824 RepID=A0AAN9KCU9_CANGL